MGSWISKAGFKALQTPGARGLMCVLLTKKARSHVLLPSVSVQLGLVLPVQRAAATQGAMLRDPMKDHAEELLQIPAWPDLVVGQMQLLGNCTMTSKPGPFQVLSCW